MTKSFISLLGIFVTVNHLKGETTVSGVNMIFTFKNQQVMHWHYEAPGMCISLNMKYSTHLQKIVTDRPTKLGTEAPSPELKK